MYGGKEYLAISLILWDTCFIAAALLLMAKYALTIFL